MNRKAFPESNQIVLGHLCKIVIAIVVGILGLGTISACGNNSAELEVPQDFIRGFVAKHETMIDQSLVYYYVKEEQQEIAQKIDTAIRINKAKGALEILEQASFDFSGMQIEIIDKKQEYVNDEPVIFVKLALKGQYTMKLPEASKKIKANDIIILQMARNEWKVTENQNPWS